MTQVIVRGTGDSDFTLFTDKVFFYNNFQNIAFFLQLCRPGALPEPGTQRPGNQKKTHFFGLR